MTRHYMIGLCGYLLGLSTEKWFVWIGWPDATMLGAIITSVGAAICLAFALRDTERAT